MKQAGPPSFQFYSCLLLHEATGLRAATIAQLLQLMRTISERSIYHHTHACLLAQPDAALPPVNDFASWVRESIGDARLAADLAMVDPFGQRTLASLRAALIGVIERHLEGSPAAHLAFAPSGRDFAFLESIRVYIPTRWRAETPEALRQALEQVGAHALFCHLADSRWRADASGNDLTEWLARQDGGEPAAAHVAGVNPYVLGLETSRQAILSRLKPGMASAAGR
jgi:hypothetical protein